METLRARWPYITAIAVLAVYLLLALCAYPALDDWIFAGRGRDQGVLAATGSYFMGWGGRWTSALVLYGMGLLPDLAVCYPLLVLSGFALAAWAVQRGCGWRSALIAGVPVLAWLPAPAEGPYWMSGGVNYLLPALLLALASTLSSSRWSMAARITLGALAAGCSETAIVLGAAAISAACLLHDRRHAWTLAGIIAGGCVAVLAPGNAARWDLIAGGQRPDLINACLTALPHTVSELFGMLPGSWLCPVAPALVALVLSAAPRTTRVGTVAAGLLFAATLAGALVALLASNATVGFIEGRQANVIWLFLVLGVVVAVWVRLIPLSGSARLGILLIWWALCWLHLATQSVNAIGALVVGMTTVAVAAWLGWCAWRHRAVVAPTWLALSALAAPGLLIACGDVWHAPQRRAEQWRRDVAVEALHAAGERRVRVPLLDPDHFTATSSVGDLQTGHWATAGYAAWHRLEVVIVDPRIHAAQATKAR